MTYTDYLLTEELSDACDDAYEALVEHVTEFVTTNIDRLNSLNDPCTVDEWVASFIPTRDEWFDLMMGDEDREERERIMRAMRFASGQTDQL